MRAHYFQHVAFEGLGTIETWLQGAGYSITRTRFFAREPIPSMEEVDFLVVMGGPMSVNDEEKLPWLLAEKQAVREAIEAGKPVLGICLGAQLIASALGAPVVKNPEPEIGWWPIKNVSEDASSDFRFPLSTMVFHWHGETFALPPGARRIAESVGCVHQAFQIGSNVIGLQFHLEMTPQSVAGLVEHCGRELVPGKFIQSASDILGASTETYASTHRLMDELLGYMLQSQ